MIKYGVIVDGYSTGGELAKEFEKHDIKCIHVQSQFTIPNVYKHTFRGSDYVELFTFAGNLKELIEKIRVYNPSFLIAGAESGVLLADKLAEMLGLPSNGTEFSDCRRNKYLMTRQVAKNKIQTIPSFHSKSLEEIIRWASEQENWPLVVKPLNSAGGDGVRICSSLEEVSSACKEILEQEFNMLEIKNEGVIIQQYISGEEYVINTVSFDGYHKLCEIWMYTRYQKKGGIQIYDSAMLIPYNEELHQKIIDYTFDVLNALNIKFGPAHVELLVNENGCFLIEMGARLMGANLPFKLLSRCVSTAQALETVLAYSNPEKFKTNLVKYQIKQNLLALFMVSSKTGIIQEIKSLDEVERLPSFFDIKLALKKGDNLFETVDYKTCPGMIYLAHESTSIINEDKEYIRNLEDKIFIV